MSAWTLGYSNPFANGMRPYLVLHVTGPSGASGPIIGIVDSGADSTCLPFGYASLMGYGPGDLEHHPGMSAAGTMDTWLAKKPATAIVQGLQQPVFEIRPLFLKNSPTPLWGRADLFQTFVVSLDEVAQTFTIATR